jgi:hypothetical protein
MGAIIYETINLFNKENNILPYKYLGSDQHNKNEYLGSSKSLLIDVKNLGKEHFEKRIICEFSEDISNVLLRKIESMIQRYIDVANNPEYYNKTNSSHKGYIETADEKSIRMKKTHIGYQIWWNNLSEVEKENHRIKTRNSNNFYNNGMKGKTYEEIYGVDVALLRKEKLKGKNNGVSKQILDIQTGKIFDTMLEAMKYYGIKKYETIRNKCIKEKGMKFL